MAAVSANTVIEIEKIITALKIGAGFDWKGALKAFEGEDAQAKILDGLILADDAAQIAGLFFPPAAVVANDLGIAIAVEPFLFQAFAWIAKQPAPKAFINQVTVWGQTTNAAITKVITGWWNTNVLARLKEHVK